VSPGYCHRVQLLPVHACPSCGSTAAAPYSIGPGTDLRRCVECSLVYAPEIGDPDEIYVDGYISGELGPDVGLNVTDPTFQGWLDFCAEKRVSWASRWARPPGTWLDVGSGTAEVLAAVDRAGWSATGVEPVAASVRWAQERRPGLDLRQGLLQDAGLPERSFDVVSAFHVLEHMTDATGFVRLLRRWVKPGGLLVIEVPNVRSFHRKGTGAGWPYLRLEHVSHFSPRTLRQTLERADVTPIGIETHGFLYRRQTLDEALVDLGLVRYRRWLGWLQEPGSRDGKIVTVPSRTGWKLLLGIEELYRGFRVGQVNFAVARVA
jgi:SAM-dependent methyltransferase